MWPIRIAYSLVGSYFVVDRLLRKGERAKSLEAGQADRGSTRAITAAYGLVLCALLAAPFLNRGEIGRLRSEKVAWGGVVAMLSGLTLRIWATQVLGSFYTRTLRVDEEQHIVMKGPYRLVRHPGYLGSLLLFVGAGIAAGNWIVIAATALPTIGSYWYRMQSEDAMLASAFPQEYPHYARHTWRLIPFVY